VRLLTLVGALREGRSSQRLAVRLEHQPGGREDVPIQGLPPAGAGALGTTDAAALTRTAPALWITDVARRPDGGLGIILRRALASSGQVDLVRLDLWRERSVFHEQFTRPVIGQQSTLFPLPPLARGAYMATFLLDGDVVAYASFAVPFRTRVAR
jgi:hypothetical protein